ncbi:MAG: hypothetical protein MI864_04205 [Pseudomonadales bacterium]|nr:hypothetical protein [Pseudomonadales bacterium]
MTTRLEELLSEALGYKADIGMPNRKLTKRDQLERDLERLQKRQIDRINKGRTRGAGAGGYNRDIENIVHQIRLIKLEIESC